jgi:hypothetical protein
MIDELELVLKQHCIDMGIINLNSPAKKVESILDSLVSAVIRSNTSLELLKQCIEDVNNDNVINVDFFSKGGNIYNYINPDYAEFAYTLFRQRSVGLGTPNAACGEGEMMFIFLSKLIQKPTKGDLLINNERIELKGEQVRVSGKISGIDFRYKTIQVCESYGLTHNRANIQSKEIFAVELEKPQYLEYWTNELFKLNLNDQKCFVIEWLKCINKKFDDFKVITRIFENDKFNHDLFLKEVVKILYVDMLEEGQFNILVLLGDGSDCKIVRGNSVRDFNRMIDTDVIQIESDYFRINQNFNVGMYIS